MLDITYTLGNVYIVARWLNVLNIYIYERTCAQVRNIGKQYQRHIDILNSDNIVNKNQFTRHAESYNGSNYILKRDPIYIVCNIILFGQLFKMFN